MDEEGVFLWSGIAICGFIIPIGILILVNN